MSSDTHAMDQLQDFLRQRRAAREPVEELEAFAQELHRLFVAAEREALGHELARFALDVPALEVDGERSHRVLRCATTSHSAAGPVRVERSLSRGPESGHAVCPLELRAGIIESACKWLIQQRFKGVGMRWSEDGFNHLLHLRLAWVNGRFEALFGLALSPNL